MEIINSNFNENKLFKEEMDLDMFISNSYFVSLTNASGVVGYQDIRTAPNLTEQFSNRELVINGLFNKYALLRDNRRKREDFESFLFEFPEKSLSNFCSNKKAEKVENLLYPQCISVGAVSMPIGTLTLRALIKIFPTVVTLIRLHKLKITKKQLQNMLYNIENCNEILFFACKIHSEGARLKPKGKYRCKKLKFTNCISFDKEGNLPFFDSLSILDSVPKCNLKKTLKFLDISKTEFSKSALRSYLFNNELVSLRIMGVFEDKRFNVKWPTKEDVKIQAEAKARKKGKKCIIQ